MAGNIQADNSGNIYVEFDYNNIIVVDPNKTIDPFGKVQDRLVDHENLVMFANLEAEVLPRTKLAVGASPEDRIRIVSIAKINFLKPTKDAFLGTGYYDELTGDESTKFKGVNQMGEQAVAPKDGSKPYIVTRPSDQKNIMDNGLLGITNINIDTNMSFIPSVRISLEDVQGRALFQLGNNSPYAAFFHLPYPPFYLTLKGFYGQAVRYQLNLVKFNARFNTFSGNYQIELDFKGYKFNVLNEISVGHLIATPHMYSRQFNVTANPLGVQQTTKAQETNSQTTNKALNYTDNRDTKETIQLTSEKGYQKIREVYSEYKSKGLIPPDFPELTLVQFITKLDMFEQNITNKFPKVVVEPLTNARTYKAVLTNYFNTVRNGTNSWFGRYLNPQPYIVNNNGTTSRYYTFKNLNLDTKLAAQRQLRSIIEDYNKQLASNPTLGDSADRTTKIRNQITYDTIAVPAPPVNTIDWNVTASLQTGDNNIELFKNQYTNLLNEIKTDNKDNEIKFFVFEGNNRFDQQITFMEAETNKKLSFFENEISKKLLEKIQNNIEGIGFKPTVRNIIAVIMASAEAFLRLLDDVHTNAWNLKYDETRKKAILYNPSSAQGSDTVQDLKLTKEAIERGSGLKYAEIPVYPWPQFFVETPEDKKGRFQLKYVADPTVQQYTGGWEYAKWPEVEFVEEYMKGLTMKNYQPDTPPPLDNTKDTNLINLNAIEFPILGVAYVNKEEVKFFYEIWERQIITSRYSNYIRANSNQVNELLTLNNEAETNNIIQSLGLSSPYLTSKLKNTDLNFSNYESFLKLISNQGTGRAWQDFIRDFYVTPYLKLLTENSFSILQLDELGQVPQLNTKSQALQKLVSNSTNDPNLTDTLPFTDTTWVQRNMADGKKAVGTDVYNTNKVLTVFEPRGVISNFDDVYNVATKRPVTNFSYRNTTSSYPTALQEYQQQKNLSVFYLTRKPTDFVVTEGEYFHLPPNLNLFSITTNTFPIRTTTSMLNTPYMVNAIQNGVENSRNDAQYPYVQAAYLFINSLPLATTKERYKSLVGDVTTDLDYISSCFKKFAGVHKIPYSWILKMGSIWHRYKVFKQTKKDILETAWKNFDYTTNYSPISKSTTQTYKFKYNSQETLITLRKENSTNIDVQVGFYPKVINDYYNFFSGYDVYKDYTDEEMQNTIDGGMKVFNFSDSNLSTTELGKNLSLKTWSVLIPSIANDTTNCDPNNNTATSIYYIVPSFGSSINQAGVECIKNPTTNTSTTTNLSSNQSMYNGSIRMLWSASNYGYFDNNQISKPSPEQYLNKFDVESNNQSPFKLLTDKTYSTIEEIFSVFDKKILDNFEKEFLDFCKPFTNIETPTITTQVGTTTPTINSDFRNFQSLYRSLMTIVPQPKNVSETEYFNDVISSQYSNFQNTMRGFLEYDVLFRYGNPSNYQRRIFDSYLSHQAPDYVTDPITFRPYVNNSLPNSSGSITLNDSITSNPNAWRSLELEVGFSTIENVRYSDRGSYITDFFIDNNIEFTEQNVRLLAPLIKMYATFKLRQPQNTVAQFKNELESLLEAEITFQGQMINGILENVRKRLPDQSQLPQGTINTVISGEQSKVENWEIFKALNDKWVAGSDFKSKTLFEDILFLDRASRNIGETIFVDIFDLRSMISKDSLNNAMSVYTLIAGILIKNNFTVMNLPAYVNFYNVQDVAGTTIPQPEGSLDFANNLWGTFLNVDYRQATPKMVCFYAGKPSQYLALPDGNFRFRDDGFEMRRASENPLLENLQGKKDWAISNRCVGFNVDIGTRNQNIFNSFTVEQDNGVATSETINAQLDMVNQATGRNVGTQNVSLYNLYKNRSYKCTVSCLGNALLQPTMYFNLRHVPMFNGPYMIQSINHTIQPGNFITTIQGIRQGIFDLPSIDTYLQSINQNLLTKLEEILKIKEDKPKPIALTDEAKSSEIVQESKNKPDAQNSCTTKVDLTKYTGYEVLETRGTEVTPSELSNLLISKYGGNQNIDRRLFIYLICYVTSYVPSKRKFVGYQNNYGLISLDVNFGATADTFFLKKYSCVNVTTPGGNNSLPIVQFKDLSTFVEFINDRIDKNINRINNLSFARWYACFWPKENVDVSYFNSNVSQFRTLIDSVDKGIDSAVETKLITKDKANEIKKGDTPTTTPTVTNATSQQSSTNAAITCEPTITDFAPKFGNTGTIVKITGTNLDSTINVFVNDTLVEPSNIQILDSQTLRIVVPQVGTGKEEKTGKMKIKTFNGETTSSQTFKFQPAVNASAASSPGSNQNNASGSQEGLTTNTNPIVPALKETVRQVSPIGTTTLLKVEVNPTAGVWAIYPVQTLTYSMKKIETGPNNTIVKKDISKGTQTLTGFVTSNSKVFTFTDMAAKVIFEGLYTSEQLKNTEFECQIQITAIPEDKEKNPQNQTLSFNYKVAYGINGSKGTNELTGPELALLSNPPGSLVLVKNTNDTAFPDYQGKSYYNIPKPGGGYYTFQFICGKPFTEKKTELYQTSTLTRQIIRVTNDATTKYTNLIQFGGIGSYKLEVGYELNDFPNVNLSATSQEFTL